MRQLISSQVSQAISGKFIWSFHDLFANSQEYAHTTHTHALTHSSIQTSTAPDLNLVGWDLLSPLAEMGLASNMLFPKIHFLCHLPSHILLPTTKLPKSAQGLQPWWRSQETHVFPGDLFGFISALEHTQGRKVSRAQGKSFFDLQSGNKTYWREAMKSQKWQMRNHSLTLRIKHHYQIGVGPRWPLKAPFQNKPKLWLELKRLL